MILVRTETPATVDALKERISGHLERLNREARAPYNLTVSIGVARAQRGTGLKELIAAADAQLYAEKRR